MAIEINLNNVQEKINYFPYSQILLPSKREPIIPIAPNTYTVREMGNVIYSEVIGKYITCWSQGGVPYVDDDIFIHLAVSDNLDFGWQTIGKIVDIPSEDPFILEENGTLYVLFERKISIGSFYDDIGLYKLTDQGDLLNGWTDLGYALQKDPLKDWQSRDVSSPTYIRENGVSYLFFEGRGEVNSVTQSGAIGLAKSTGIEDSFIYTDLIISGVGFDGREPDINWGNSLVPDDVFQINGIFYISAHVESTDDSKYYTGIFESNDLENGWEEKQGSNITYSNRDTNINGQGAPFFEGSSFIISDNKIYHAKWGNGFVKNQNLDDVSKVGNETSVKLTGSTFFENKTDNDFAQIKDINSIFKKAKFTYGSGAQEFMLPTSGEFIFSLYINGLFSEDYTYDESERLITITSMLTSGDIINVVYKKGTDPSIWFPFNGGTEANIRINTVGEEDWIIDWGDGIIETHPSGITLQEHIYSSDFYGVVKITADVRIFSSTSGSFNFTNIGEYNSLENVFLNGNLFTGDLSSLKDLDLLNYVYLRGNLLTGVMSNVIKLPLLTYFYATGNFTINYTSTTFAPNFQRILFRPTTAINALDSNEIDQLLIDASQTTWSGTKDIFIDGNNGIRTSASDAAVLTLQAMGVTLNLNV